MKRLLVIDDEPLIRDSLKRLLEKNNYQVLTAESVEDAIQILAKQACELILSDLRLPGEEGTRILEYFPDIPVIIMTSYASVSSAVDAMKMGAKDYISKPFDHTELLLMVKRILKERKLEIENTVLKQQLSREHQVYGMIGDCPAMQEVNQRIHKVAPLDTSVLILGETGTGKELVARAIHEYSTRSAASLISINCAAIAENLIESELFGYNRGAFTGADRDHPGLIEAADGGTLFLDEIGELSLDIQAHLLRVLQEGEVRRVGSTQSRKVDVRLIAATHKNLQDMVDAGQFRSDLFFRLNVFDIRLPPLKERNGDIIKLADYFLEDMRKKMAKPEVHFSAEVLVLFQQYDWPGNIREMQNVIERAVILADGNKITQQNLSLFTEEQNQENSREQFPESEPLMDVDKEKLSLDEYLIHFLKVNEHLTETELARHLGISRKTLWEKRNRLNIPKRAR